jgi:hypothetical protein
LEKENVKHKLMNMVEISLREEVKSHIALVELEFFFEVLM